ncbi:MAG: hypothetical protein QOD77_2172 [Thermoplasmata archaeon]|jgi:hypothetical protein|nr:hypothetical protein [Thermoplasmata archaeon]
MSPQGDKSAYTGKQKRQAHHIEKSVKRRGGSSRTAARIAYATVNKQDKGGKKGGTVKSRAGRATRTRNAAGRFTKARKTAKRATRKTAARKTVRKTAKRANRSKRTVATQRRSPERAYERKEHLNPMQKILSVFR